MTFMLAACGPAAPQTGGAGGQQTTRASDWRTEWDNTIAGAKREGTIRIISGSSSTNNIPNFEKAFAEMTGGKVEFTELRAPDIIARLPEEYAARQHNWDIILL